MNRKPYRLFELCCDCLLILLENLGSEANFVVAKLTSGLTQELLERAIVSERAKSKINIWKDFWTIFLTKNIVKASVPWNFEVIQSLTTNQQLVYIRVVYCEKFVVSIIKLLPKSVDTLAFDLEWKMSEIKEEQPSWLPEAEQLLKSMMTKPISLQLAGASLTEVDMESVSATSADLQVILCSTPDLKYLRHYQMVKALYESHVQDWKRGIQLPKYKLRNLDVDFSHVIRCSMSPKWLLSPDALQLAVVLCPQAVAIRLRFDCSTPNDVLMPLLNLDKIKQFSAVCVTSGERTNLDFTDMAPLLEKFGQTSLNYLELKVIEEVEVHVIILWCSLLETLILSGCGYVTPPTCPSYSCHQYHTASFSKLKHIFFADGDDFSWDHGATECFWKSALLPSGVKRPKLQGLFLENPRIPDQLTAEIFSRDSDDEIPFPDIQVATLCRYNELSLADVVSMCGLEKKATPPLRFLRISECEKIEASNEKSLKNWFKQCRFDCSVSVDWSPPVQEEKRYYTYKIGRSGR